MKKEMYPPESEVLAEAHFKLSLALEFASVTTTQEEGAPAADQAPFDEKLREEAISELEAAIASTRLKLQAKEVELAEMANPEENVATKASINDVKDIIEDMEQRVSVTFELFPNSTRILTLASLSAQGHEEAACRFTGYHGSRCGQRSSGHPRLCPG